MTLVPLPESDYLNAIGKAAYAVGYLEWAVLGFLPNIESLPEALQLEALVGKPTGFIGQQLQDEKNLNGVKDSSIVRWLRLAGERLVAVAQKRNAILHARPATTADGKQRLYRWTTVSGQQFFIDEQYLDDFLAEIDGALREVNRIRPHSL